MPVPPEAPARSILVAAHNPKLRARLRQLLSREGYIVAEAGTGAAAMKALRRHPPLVLLDLHLPGNKGLAILREARRVSPRSKVILAPATADEAAAGLREGAMHVLRYPLEPAELLSLCRTAFDVDAAVADTDTRRPERAALERAAMSRVTSYLTTALHRAPLSVLERALGRPDSPEAVAEVVGGVLVEDGAAGAWGAALLEGAKLKARLLEDSGGVMSAPEVGELLGIGRAAVDKRRRTGTLLGLKLPSGDIGYPAAQFGARGVLAGLPEVLAAFRVGDPWMQLDILLDRHDHLGNRTGFEALRSGDVERLTQVVSSVGDQGL